MEIFELFNYQYNINFKQNINKHKVAFRFIQKKLTQLQITIHHKRKTYDIEIFIQNRYSKPLKKLHQAQSI